MTRHGLATAQPLVLRTDDGLRLAARLYAAPTSSATTVVLVHGFAGSQDDDAVVSLAGSLVADGFDVLTYDARGHGASEGHCTLGDHERLDVHAAVAWARGRAGSVVAVGASMGAIAVLRQAATDPDLDGVVAVSGPAAWRLPRNPRTLLAAAMTRTRLGRHLTRRHLRVHVHPEWRDPAPPLALIPRIDAPVAIVHGRRDRFIALREAYDLYRHAGRRSRLFVVDDMTHGYDAASVAAIRAAIAWTLAEDRRAA